MIQFLLHACAQNPTGIDPTQEQWKELSDLFKSKKHLPLFDMVNLLHTSTHVAEESENRADTHVGIPRIRLGRYRARRICCPILC